MRRGEYAGDAWGEPLPCALKEYSLDEASGKEWKKLVTEVTLLARLSHPHIVEVEAVFHQIEPRTRLNKAYVQLPFYAQGDAARWLDECDPPPPLEARQGATAARPSIATPSRTRLRARRRQARGAIPESTHMTSEALSADVRCGCARVRRTC